MVILQLRGCPRYPKQQFSRVPVTGIANVGKYKFIRANRTYPGVVSDQTGQNYDALVFGDVASPYVH